MDYHVFILSRIRELRRGGETTPCAITAGIANSAGVVSSAALIMVAVFSIFIGMGQVELKMLGVGLAAAILLDATIAQMPLGRWPFSSSACWTRHGSFAASPTRRAAAVVLRKDAAVRSGRVRRDDGGQTTDDR